MKKLPCSSPQCGGFAQAPGGGPVVVGRLSSNPLSYPCRGCRRVQRIYSQQWNRLPDLSDEEAQQVLTMESGRLPTPGAQPFAQDPRTASSLLSPTVGRLVR